MKQNITPQLHLIHEDPRTGSHIVATSMGADKLSAGSGDELQRLVGAGIAVDLGASALVSAIAERGEYLGSGNEADVFGIGDIAIRRTRSPQSLLDTARMLGRMQPLSRVVESSGLDWVTIPAQYVTLVDGEKGEVFTLMDRVGDSVSAEDIQRYPKLCDSKMHEIEKIVGTRIQEAQRDIPAMIDAAYNILHGGLEIHGLDPGVHLADWNAQNILVTKSPTGDLALNVIDQYCA